MQIAVDGPAASGKSSVAAEVARKLGYLYFDTGIMYRAATLAAIQSGIDLADEVACTQLAEKINIEVGPASIDDGRPADVVLDGKDVTWQIRQAKVDAGVSQISAYAKVRELMVAQQRRIGDKGNIIMAGRDIGTVVLPNAPIKIYLTASVEARAQRRHYEALKHGQNSHYEDVLAAMRQRDHTDSSRATSPLRPADDAIIINTTHLQQPQAIAKMYGIIASYIAE